MAAGRLKAKPSGVFRFEDIHEAHRVMEAGEGKGKMVVVLTDRPPRAAELDHTAQEEKT
ncbi:zinc-binding dehydrogenase [Streptomyces sp. PSAA01]|uniref:zinc-binding dehydrogenase n=1 Tax=Streptomyces sp. PSAA01 TaxID=2912762 RepID=UPI001F1DBB4B|nr:zinc-binding dehydrogenase [Streptomyces sp. PSAA01]MCG0285531.1 zinc-binding dehydrogenase [Streptomyces sp. PSAA01]